MSTFDLKSRFTLEYSTDSKTLHNLEESQFARSRRAFLVGLILPGQPGYVVEEHLDELAQLAETADAVRWWGGPCRRARRRTRRRPSASGKAEEIAAAARELGADLLIFDDDLSGSQAKNLEELTKLPVMDRSALILDIFDLRAQSREARTQVELARLKYMLPRLTRQWSHLSRQGGGVGHARRRG